MHLLVFTASNPLRGNISTSYWINYLKSTQEILHVNQIKNSNTCIFISIHFLYCLLTLRICYAHTFVLDIQNIGLCPVIDFLRKINNLCNRRNNRQTDICSNLFLCLVNWGRHGEINNIAAKVIC